MPFDEIDKSTVVIMLHEPFPSLICHDHFLSLLFFSSSASVFLPLYFFHVTGYLLNYSDYTFNTPYLRYLSVCYRCKLVEI